MADSSDRKIGSVLCVSGPSGSGKTSLCDKLSAEMSNAVRSISYTTRPIRPGEVTGASYYFVSPEEFKKMEAAGAFIETAEVFGNRYGTPKGPVEEAIKSGKVIIIDIDTVGAAAIKSQLNEACVTVFIMPPSQEELARRLNQRKQNSPEDLERRLQEAKREMLEAASYEHVIENQEFEEAYLALKAIAQKSLGLKS